MDEFVEHKCMIKGDNTYKSIAAASILAKTTRDNYILNLVKENPELEKYGNLKIKVMEQRTYGSDKKNMELQNGSIFAHVK